MAAPLTITLSPPVIPAHPFSTPRQHGPPLLSRPKLSLNTSTCTARTLGRGNTGLRLDVLSGNSPTSVNTFRNTYDEAKASQGTSVSSTHASTNPSDPSPRAPTSPHIDNTRRSSSDSTASTTSTTSTTTPPQSPQPTYTLPPHIHPILTNSRLPKRARTAVSVSSATTPKLLFPPVKRVCFKQPLVEEVPNSILWVRHSDSVDGRGEEGEDEDDRWPGEVEPQEGRVAESRAERPRSPLGISSKNLRRKCHDDADDSQEDDEDEEEDTSSYPQTPIAGRRKRVRDWRWTLGPQGPGHDTTTVDGADDGHDKDLHTRV